MKSEQSVIHKRDNSHLQQRLLNKSFSFKALVTIQTEFHNAQDHNYCRAGHFQQGSQKAKSFLSWLFHFFCNNNYNNNFLKNVQDVCIPVITAIIESLYELETDFKAWDDPSKSLPSKFGSLHRLVQPTWILCLLRGKEGGWNKKFRYMRLHMTVL